MKKIFAAAALATTFAFPMAASAVTTDIFKDSFYSVNQVFPTPVPSSLVFQFDAQEDLRVMTVSLSATASTSGLDTVFLEIIRGTNNPPAAPSQFDVINAAGTQATSTIPSFVLMQGDFFRITFTGSPIQGSSITTSFDTAPVPLPAAGGMLLLAVIAGGVAGRRKTQKA